MRDDCAASKNLLAQSPTPAPTPCANQLITDITYTHNYYPNSSINFPSYFIQTFPEKKLYTFKRLSKKKKKIQTIIYRNT